MTKEDSVDHQSGVAGDIKNPLRLLVVDDSNMMHAALSDIFDKDPEVQIVANATDGVEALAVIRQHDPDVVTLDVNMPVMDGITALKHMMIHYPRPTVMLSSLTMEGAAVTFDALRYGAVDFIAKPSALDDGDLGSYADEIRSKIKFAAAVELEASKYIRSRTEADSSRKDVAQGRYEKIVAMGAAEGGYSALLKIIPHLPADLSAAYLVTLYAAPEYVDAFADYLNACSAVEVKRAVHEEMIRSGVCYLNSGANYMSVHREGDECTLHISPAPFASRKGAVDMLLFSSADALGADCVGVVLSGSGGDGAEGLEEILHLGGTAIVQDPKTCLCKDMAQAALNRSRCDYVISDAQVAATVADVLNKGDGKSG